jgi:hypothetical protein
MTTVACGGDDDDSARRTPRQEPAIVLVPGDGGVSSTAITAPPGVDPSSMHLDDVGGHAPIAPRPLPNRERRAIDVTLRSSPPGARVAVDGTAVGITPSFWSGYADGREHEFVFTLPGHAIARYRFVPVSSGVIHARLEPIIEERDVGMRPPPEVVPSPSPSAVVPPAPPPTIVPAQPVPQAPRHVAPQPTPTAPAPQPPVQPAPPAPSDTQPAQPPEPPPAAPSGHGPQP